MKRVVSSRWYRAPSPPWVWDSGREANRLMNAIGDAGIASLVCVALAAHVVAEQRGCELREAWDRLALRFEQMDGDSTKSLGKMRIVHRGVSA